MRIAALATLAALLATVALFPPVAPAQVASPPKTPTAVGSGGAAATVDPIATQAAIDVLRSGANAVDAAVAAAGVLGVVEPFSCGIGGGGFMVIYDAKRRRVDTIDSRETAPAAFQPESFQENGQPIPFAEAVTSGLGVGVPGTVRGWQAALDHHGTRSLASLLKPGKRIARHGFVVDQTYRDQTEANRDRFDDFTSTREVYLTEDGAAPEVGSVVDNPDMARTYARLQGGGPGAFYRDKLARAIVETVKRPPTVPGTTRKVRPGLMETSDLAAYRAKFREPTKIGYRGLDVYGMAPPSSGGSTVGESLNILEGFTPLGRTRDEALHRYLEASKLSFADRNAYVGDPDFVRVPLRGLLSDDFAAERRAKITDSALSTPQPAGSPWPHDSGPGGNSTAREGRSTTHLTVSDRFGNVVSYTFTIEQTGGSGIVVPEYGFLLNNELTDFEFATGFPNSPAGGKRPRSSMSPTIVFDHGRPVVALGSPGGSMIITTVLQILVNHFDFGQDLPAAVAAPRASQRNGPSTSAEPAFITSDGPALQALGHTFTSTPEIGAATGIRFLSDGRQQAVAEPTRRGGGSALVVRPG
jgi:gamma-glutamyltranspeptidase/glutathione hydrolase